jgi:hypothetical protein
MSGNHSGPVRMALAVGLAAIAFGAWAAIRKAWLCDDAFISFRYADNLTHGLGLVFNAGERVEGYSNFLWTLGIALGMRAGVAPERWSIVWGVVFYVATLVLLLLDHLIDPSKLPAAPEDRTSRTGPPLACLLAAVHSDWQQFATGGLETALFTFLVTAGYLLGVRARGVLGLAGSGLAFALAALTRPDGVLFFPIMGLYLLWSRRPRAASLASFAGAFLAVWLPYAIWKTGYYGEFLPNTYYAKSAYLPWYEQGWHYVSLYFQRYWVLALALPVAAGALVLRAKQGPRVTIAAAQKAPRAPAAPVRRTPWDEAPVRELLLALAMGVAYTTYVMHVGGDFMYARLLIPAAPFFAIALARGIALLLAQRRGLHWAVATAATAGLGLSPMPLHDAEITHGIIDEPRVYLAGVIERTRRNGLTLRRYFEGLPVRMAFVGSQAALVYYARPAVAIECGTGLTDRWIAHQPLLKRGRVGHEKVAPVSYLLRRKVDFTIRHFAGATLGLDEYLPMVPIAFDTIPGRIVHWDPVLLAELARRGARFANVPAEIDRFASMLDRTSDEQVRDAYRRLKYFYFDSARDSVRERMFLSRMERMK